MASLEHLRFAAVSYQNAMMIHIRSFICVSIFFSCSFGSRFEFFLFFGVPSNLKRVSILNFPEENGLLRLVCHIMLCHCRVFAAPEKKHNNKHNFGFWYQTKSNEKTSPKSMQRQFISKRQWKKNGAARQSHAKRTQRMLKEMNQCLRLMHTRHKDLIVHRMHSTDARASALMNLTDR